jgi:hypothetical protein
LALLRHAVNQDWDVPADVRSAALADVMAELDSGHARRMLSAVRIVIAMEAANIRAAET